MSWGSLSDFLAMGGYGLYVWGSYAMFFGLIGAEAVLLLARRRSILNHLALIARERRHRRAGAA